mmetsp:Transcript_6871/g.29275  ORF Transcript_6871/g.29275 Transcript_6871/m.29275 type:complete len:268 (+) Transcript_6871:1464-2267(+)
MRRIRRPHKELIVVPARREFAIVVRPLQAAHLALVSDELARELLGRAHVALQDVPVAAPRGERGRAPRQRPDARAVPAHHAHLLALVGVPDLHLALVGAHRQVRASLRPGHGAHGVARPEVAQLRDAARARAPQVHARPQPHRQHVVRRPVHQVQVEVILQRRRVQHLERRPRDFARRAPRVAAGAHPERPVRAHGGQRVRRLLWDAQRGQRLCVRLETEQIARRRRAVRVPSYARDAVFRAVQTKPAGARGGLARRQTRRGRAGFA